MRPKVVVVGHTCADLAVFGLKQVPARGTLGLCSGARVSGGGPGFAGAVALARLGAQTNLVGAVGDDVMALGIKQLARESRVKAHLVEVPGVMTSCTAVLVDADGERTFLHWPGPNRQLRARHVSGTLLRATNGLLVSGLGLIGLDADPCKKLFKRAGKNGIFTAIDTVDPGFQTARAAFPKLEPALPFAGLVCVSRKESCPFTGRTSVVDVCGFLREHGAQLIMFKMGEKGIAVKEGDCRPIRVPAFRIRPKDTTGSGDAASAAFVYRRLEGYDIEACARFAAAVGAIVAMKGIGTAGTPTAAEVVKFMARTPCRR